eukprot:TRINITY_DN24737_c0_g1_i1.p1 TRINITY_DN24737_c0_g1~~TRINITY_DN24737_c0_g1_i1.p1  ORF type:complete len:142 (+),score=28.46 TRINITY_DN24737_c0_g1_i1:63-428(+)
MQSVFGSRLTGSLYSRVVGQSSTFSVQQVVRRALCAKTDTAVSVAAKSEVAKPEAKPKVVSTFGSRLRSFSFGFAVAGTLTSYMLFMKVQWASEELNAMLRDVALRQAKNEAKLAQLERFR